MTTSLEEAFKIKVLLSPSYDIGAVPTGIRRVIPIIGGEITGSRLRGEVLNVGADWNLVQSDGIVFISARYLLRTHDGVVISILNEGWLRSRGDIMANILAGHEISKRDWYCKTHPRFEVADPRYRWLNESVFLAEMLPPPAPLEVNMIFFEVL